MRLGSPVFAGHCLGQFWRLYRYVRMKSPFGINNATVTAAQEHFRAVLGAALSFARRRSNYPHLTTQSFIQSFSGHWGQTELKESSWSHRNQVSVLKQQRTQWKQNNKEGALGRAAAAWSGEKAASHWEGGGPLWGGGPTSWDPNATTRPAVHSTRGALIPSGSWLGTQEGQGHQQPRHRLRRDKVSAWPGRGSGARCLQGAPWPLKGFDFSPLYL